MQYEKLFSPGRIGKVTMKNRIIMGPTETLYASAYGEVTQAIIDYYEERARGGVGMIVIHSVQGNTDVDTIDPYAGSLRLDNDAYIPMLSQLTERLHRYGTKVAVLVSIGGGAKANGDTYLGKSPAEPDVLIAPSAMPEGTKGRRVREMTIDEIRRTVEAYGKCAFRARRAGCDVFYIHALGGYLLAEFLSPIFNHRTDAYGGSLENRARLLLELIRSCRENAGDDFPLVVRLSIDERTPDGRSFEESRQLIKMIERAGVSAVDISVGYAEQKQIRMPSIYVDCGVSEPYVREVKQSLSIPVILQGKYHDPNMANRALENGVSDFILISRGLIAEPQWPNLVAAGRWNEARKCLSCNYCLAKRIVNKLPLRCAFNPVAGRESDLRFGLPRVSEEKRIAVIGAGPAGLELTRVLALRGHSVDVFEAGDALCSGQLRLAQRPPKKTVLKNVPDYYQTQLSKMRNVRIHLHSHMTAEKVKTMEADIIVFAVGAVPFIPGIPGIDRKNVITAQDVLSGARTEQSVIVAGGGQIGTETAHFLASAGKSVTIVEMQDRIAVTEEPNTRNALLQELSELNVSVKTGLKILGFESGGVRTSDICSGEESFLPGKTIVVAFGTKEKRDLIDSCRNDPRPQYVIGDANRTGTIRAAIEAGFMLGLEL